MYLSHGYGRTSGVGQHRTQQQTVLEYGSGYPHGGVEVGIVAAVFFGIPVVVPFAEEGEDRRQTHGKQSVTEYDAAKVFVSLYQGGFEPERVVVERNLEIVPKEQLAQVVIQDEDVIEVLRFVGGG